MQELLLTHKKLTLLPNEIPDTIDTHIVDSINAAHNKINKLTSFQHFSNLQILHLSHNSLGNCFKSLNFVLEGLHNLKGLSLASNQITMLGEHVFSKCQQIRNLDLSDNKLNSTFRCLIYVQELQILDLRNNSIDNICNFKPLKLKLPNLICIKLKGNAMEEQYQNSYEQIVIDYFPSLQFVVTKYNKVKDEDIFALLSTNMHDILSINSSEMDAKFKKTRSLSTHQIPQVQCAGQRSLTPIKNEYQSVQPNLISNICEGESLNLNNFQQETSTIKEEYSQENSIISPHLYQFVESPFMVTLGTRNIFSSCKKHSTDRKRRGGSSAERSNLSQKSYTSDQKIEQLITQGRLQKEVDRLNGMLEYKQKEIARVNSSIQDEKRQSLQLYVLCQGFEELVKLTLGIDDEFNAQFFTEAMKQIKQFTSTIDIFAPEKVKTQILEIIQPLFNKEFHDLEQKLVGLQCVIDKLKKCSLLI